MAKRTGQCLCGAVTLSADIPDGSFLACQCGQCRRWTGGGPLYSIAAENVEFAGQESVSEYFMSDWGARGFCRACGTTLYWRMRDRGVTSLAVGLLDDQSGLALTEEIFCDRRPEWLPAVPGASQSTEADEMQKLADYMARKSGE